MIVDQTEFADALLNPDIAAPNGLVDPNGRPAGKRFDVHRNNVIFSLINAMQIAFPVVHKLLGDNIFNAISATYVRNCPPKSPIMMFYGEDFPAFLSEVQQSQNLPYLGDVARLELARRHSYHAADISAIAPEKLAHLSPEDLLNIKLTLSPTMQIVASVYPILSIWQMNMVQDFPQIDMFGEVVMISRLEHDVEMHKLDPPTHVFLTQLKDVSLGRAYDAALEIDKGFELNQAIGLLLSQNVIINIP
ncbi:MAG: DNA-binding domain-containing protein [Amylibacter sp.]